MRKPVDRIGYGGYLSLAYKFPDFVEYVGKVCDEFREIYDNINNVKPYCGLKVAILNCWGKLRTWQTHMVAHSLWYKQIYTYLGVIEALSGMSFDVEFISFDDIKENGISSDVDVIINAGDSGTAFSGGEKWIDEKISVTLREWIFNGGGFVGIGEPSAMLNGGRFFQMADALGVDKELGFSLSTDKYFKTKIEKHFITEDINSELDFGESVKNIYANSDSTEIIEIENDDVMMAANVYGKGRAVYIAGLPYSSQNARILMRSCYYAANKEEHLKEWYCDNIYCEVSAYIESNKYAVINNSNEKQKTKVYEGSKNAFEIELEPAAIRWFKIK